MSQNIFSKKIAIIGLGYVGLPLLMSFSKKFDVIGYDINLNRINEIKKGTDSYNEYQIKKNLNYKNCKFTNNFNKLENIDIFIVTVPTPVYKNNKPNLRSLKVVSKNIGRVIKKNAIVVFESTVYPGATEEVCVPIIAKNSGMKYNKDFFCGYSPERINPGDRKHQLKDIVKIVSGSNKSSLKIINKLYSSIISAGTHIVSNIKTAEAAKIIENTQRDINIALMNELYMIFNKLDIDTKEVLDAASTKWNFNSYSPGLVGGHCISVDPYYLVDKAKEIGHNPKIILSGRSINDNMANYVAKRIEFIFSKNGASLRKKKICIFGVTFKENCADTRNTQVVKIVKNLRDKGSLVHIYDPIANKREFKDNFQFSLIDEPRKNYYDIILLAVPHQFFFELGISNIKSYGKKSSFIYDLKAMFDSKYTDLR